ARKPIQILKAIIIDSNEIETSEFGFKEPVFLQFTVKNLSSESDVRYNVAMLDIHDRLITVDSKYVLPNQGYTTFKVALPVEFLTPNQYKVGLSIDIPSVRLIEIVADQLSFE